MLRRYKKKKTAKWSHKPKKLGGYIDRRQGDLIGVLILFFQGKKIRLITTWGCGLGSTDPGRDPISGSYGHELASGFYQNEQFLTLLILSRWLLYLVLLPTQRFAHSPSYCPWGRGYGKQVIILWLRRPKWIHWNLSETIALQKVSYYTEAKDRLVSLPESTIESWYMSIAIDSVCCGYNSTNQTTRLT